MILYGKRSATACCMVAGAIVVRIGADESAASDKAAGCIPCCGVILNEVVCGITCIGCSCIGGCCDVGCIA